MKYDEKTKRDKYSQLFDFGTDNVMPFLNMNLNQCSEDTYAYNKIKIIYAHLFANTL